jgi:hypothetical protein
LILFKMYFCGLCGEMALCCILFCPLCLWECLTKYL